jgi:1-acyl-sn-glycerol-3-phosphate acyltransferase
MKALTQQNTYQSPDRKTGWMSRHFPSAVFYAGIVSIVIRAARLAKRGEYHADDWINSSLVCVDLLESVGGRFIIENLDVVKNIASPCVFVGNHMSVLETFILPCLIRPHRQVTFVIKDSLVAYPAFKHVMVSREPIVVGRVDPRHDLKTVFKEGQDRLDRGKSVIIFPQTTRSIEFDPNKFNSLGTKLAKRAGVPVIPIALKTDAWAMGTWFKDIGRIRPDKIARFSFGEALTVNGSGKDEHQMVVDYISSKLDQWKSDNSD